MFSVKYLKVLDGVIRGQGNERDARGLLTAADPPVHAATGAKVVPFATALHKSSKSSSSEETAYEKRFVCRQPRQSLVKSCVCFVNSEEENSSPVLKLTGNRSCENYFFL